MHNLTMIAFVEPSAELTQINSNMSQLNMDHANRNFNNKIQLFWTCDLKFKVMEANEQYITCEINHVDCAEIFAMTYMYAKCKDHLRRSL